MSRPLDDDAPLGEMTVPPDAYQWRSQRARLGFWPLVARGLLFSAVVIGLLVAVTWATGWAAVEIDAWRGGR